MIKEGKILILEDIEVDRKLPKYIKETTNPNGFMVNPDGQLVIGQNRIIDGTDQRLSYLEYLYRHAPSFLLWIKIRLYKWLRFDNMFENKILRRMTPKDMSVFFESVKVSLKKVEQKKIDDVLSKYGVLLQNAEDNRQIALIEKIKDYSIILKNELHLSVSGFNRYIKEEDQILKI